MFRPKALFAALALILVGLGVGPAVAQSAFPATIQLPQAWQPEGITIRGTTFYVGSIPTGSIYRGNLRTGTGEDDFIQRTGRAAIGLALDQRNRLFVAGGNTGKAWVYNVRTRADIAEFTLGVGFINDVVVTRRGAYFTNSNRAEIYRIPIGNGGALGTPQTIPLSAPFQLQTTPTPINANGIDATPNGRWLIIVQSNAGKLFRVNPTTGATVEIALTGGDGNVLRGDGILLTGNRRLYVVQNTLNKIAVIQLNQALTAGRIVNYITDSRFAVPTTIDDLGRRLYAVNARFGTPPATADYDVIQVRKPQVSRSNNNQRQEKGEKGKKRGDDDEDDDD